MKKINNNLIHFFFNNLIFITNKSFYINFDEIYTKTDKWILLRSDLSIIYFKKILRYLYSIQFTNERNTKKILFIIDENIFSFFYDFISYNCYLTSSIKESFDFLSNKKFLKNVSCIIYIGPESDFNVLKNFNIPFFGFTFQNSNLFDYHMSVYTHFNASLLFLKSCLFSLLKYEKKYL